MKATQEDCHERFLSFSSLQASKELSIGQCHLDLLFWRRKARLPRQMPTSSKKLTKKKVPRNSETRVQISGIKWKRVTQEKHTQQNKLGTSYSNPADANEEATGTLWMSLLASKSAAHLEGSDEEGSSCLIQGDLPVLLCPAHTSLVCQGFYSSDCLPPVTGTRLPDSTSRQQDPFHSCFSALQAHCVH